MRFKPARSAFSLLEVVLAIGVFAAGITVILGLLGSLHRAGGQAGQARTAANLASAVTVELQCRAAGQPLAGLAGTLPVMTTANDDGYKLVAAADGGDVRVYDPGETPRRDQFFLIEARTFPAGPLAYTTGSGCLIANIRVSWPFRPPGSGIDEVPVDAGARDSLSFNTAVSR